MSLIVSLLNVKAEAMLGRDEWSRVRGAANSEASRCTSPFRASLRARKTQLFGAK